jgi:O-antigen ligase/polysaccharide polymerase Wzy-like membrane protein
MLGHVKELVVVLGLAVAMFALARPICLNFMFPEDFRRRRNSWLLLTIVAFLSPSFWIYIIVAAFVLAWNARRDSNPASIYLLAYSIIPPIYLYVPVVAINQLFPMTEARLLALVLLLPLALRLLSRNNGTLASKWTGFDLMVVMYVLLQIVISAPYDSTTTTMRQAFLLSIDILVVFYVFSRALARREALVDAMAVFVLVSSVYAAIGIFESFKGWLLYEQLGPAWGAGHPDFSFLMRGDSLRAQASAGHSLTFGYTLTIALGFWLHLRRFVDSKWARWLGTLLLCVGIFVSHSRGPWLAAVLVYFAYLVLSPAGASGFIKGTTGMLVIFGALAVTPFGGRIIDILPFIGSADQGTIAFRQQLAEESWRLIQQNPFFGDPFVLSQMEDLRQGQGFVDMMNAYAAIALLTGLTGLALVMGFLVGPAVRGFRALKAIRASDPDFSSLGAALVACMIASLFFMATASIDWIEYVLAAMLCAYASAVRSEYFEAPSYEGHQTPITAAAVGKGRTFGRPLRAPSSSINRVIRNRP